MGFNNYNDNDEIVLKDLPKSIKVDKDVMLVRDGEMSIDHDFGSTIDKFTSEHVTCDITDTFRFRPSTSVTLTFFVNNNTSDEYLFKIKNFKISYKQYTD